MRFICFCFFVWDTIFFEESCIYFFLIWLLYDFITHLMKYFQIQIIWPFLGQKSLFLIFWLVWDLFAFVSYTRIFWRTLSIFHFNLIVIWFSYMFKELFTNSVNLTLFRAKKEIFDFFTCIRFICFCFFCLIQDFFEESCLFFIVIWLLSDFLTSLKNYFQIQLIWPFLGPKREIFDFLT